MVDLSKIFYRLTFDIRVRDGLVEITRDDGDTWITCGPLDEMPECVTRRHWSPPLFELESE